MSYDIRFGVKVAGADDLFVEIGRPTFDSPTYNLGTMFRKCTGWDYNQGEWYNVAEVLPLIQHGIHELKFNPESTDSTTHQMDGETSGLHLNRCNQWRIPLGD